METYISEGNLAADMWLCSSIGTRTLLTLWAEEAGVNLGRSL